MQKIRDFFDRSAVKSVLSSLISVLIGLVFGSLLVLIVSMLSGEISLKSGIEGVKLVFLGVFCKGREAGELVFGLNTQYLGDLLFRATPLILTGLSVSVAFKTGLFNIGAPGQYLMGTAATLYLALSIPQTVVPAWAIWIIAFAGGVIAGAIWGAIPGILKATLNINEVIACIMTNWISANIVTWIFENSSLRNASEASGGKIGYIKKTIDNGVATPKLGLDKLLPGSQVNAGIILAIIIAILVYIIMTKTTFGYQLKACGSNRFAAKYAGIAASRNIVFSMAIAGGLSGAAAALYYLSGNTEFFWSTYQSLPAVGFNGIPVALLAVNHPIGVIFAGLFMSMLNISGTALKYLTPYNEYITDIIIASIVYLSAFSLMIKMWLGKKKKALPEVKTAKKEETV
ncbi:MAG: ABC transporter permease [Clostridia bacterium]|nr:ABC transporter permease [Clostridia bacterium]